MDTNRCKTVDETSPMNAANSLLGVRRNRHTDATSSGSSKRRKFECGNQSSVVQLENHCSSEIDVNLLENNVCSAEFGDRAVSSPCLNDNLSLDLKTELRFKTEASISSNDGFSRETSSSSEICLDSEEMDSSSTLKTNQPPLQRADSHYKQLKTAITPTTAEIDEFFSAIEKKEQQRFTEKYNYDVVNDVPTEGRYQWVLLKP